MKRLERGFTLVELLIVIVVIGILAAITLIAYNGIQDKAKNAALLSAFDATEKALRMYKIQNGTYPVATDLPSGVTYACIGSDLTPASAFPNASNGAASCWVSGSTVSGADSPQIDSALKSVINPLPATESYAISANGLNLRGLLYYGYGGGANATLFYFVNGSQTCGRGSPTPAGSGATECILTLNG